MNGILEESLNKGKLLIYDFCRSTLGDVFTLSEKSLSELSPVFVVALPQALFVAKCVFRNNFSNNLDRSSGHFESIITITDRINKSAALDFGTIPILESFIGEDYALFLMPKVVNLEPLKDSSLANLRLSIQTLKKFHNACAPELNTLTDKQPNYLSTHYLAELKKSGAWESLSMYFNHDDFYVEPSRQVVCHNDLHSGNICFIGDTFSFIDFDDVAVFDKRSDMGMLCCSVFFELGSAHGFIKIASEALKVYENNNEEPRSEDVRGVLIFGIRKLIHACGYYLLRYKEEGRASHIRSYNALIDQIQKISLELRSL